VTQPSASGILLVDDDPTIRLYMSRGLSAAGFTVFDAPHGAAALAVLDLQPLRIGLVITDVRMPVMDGLALARTIRAQWPRMPIIFMSGAVGSQHVAELGRSEVLFLAKPFAVDVLDAIIRQALGIGPASPPTT
jgi:two-component system, cell cycle sensor histidine kinase and response regulator CckA